MLRRSLIFARQQTKFIRRGSTQDKSTIRNEVHSKVQHFLESVLFLLT